MTIVEQALDSLRQHLGWRWVEWVRANLPSRKPQLWEQPVHSLLRRVRHGLHSHLDPEWTSRRSIVELRDSDTVMELTPRNQDLDLALFLYGVYEIAGTRFVQAFLKPGMTFIDVGANGGYYSLIAARLVEPGGHVYAVEPARGPYAKLVRNIALNGLQNVTADRIAVGRERGRSLLYESKLHRNDGVASLMPGTARAAQGEAVEVVTLSMIAERVEPRSIALVKIDVEGAELDVLTGGQSLLAESSAPALLFESFDVTTPYQFLTHCGYEVRHVHYSLAEGLRFPRIGERFDNSFEAYEAPNYVAVKSAHSGDTFRLLVAQSVRRIPNSLRWLASLA